MLAHPTQKWLNPKMEGANAPRSSLGGANADVRNDLLKVQKGSRSFFIKVALRTYQLVDKLVHDQLKLVESSQLVELTRKADENVMEELANLKTELVSVKVTHQEKVEKEKAKKNTALATQEKLEGKLVWSQDEVSKTHKSF